jgi:hypothetical protein
MVILTLEVTESALCMSLEEAEPMALEYNKKMALLTMMQTGFENNNI